MNSFGESRCRMAGWKTRAQRAAVGLMMAGALTAQPLLAWAKQDVVVHDDSPIAVTISASQLTLIKMPSAVVTNGLMTVSPAFEIRANGSNVAIDPKGSTAPGDLVVMTEHQSYLFQLTPRPIPAELIVVQDVRLPAAGGKPESDPLKRLESYVETNVELIRQVVEGSIPKTCMATKLSEKNYPKWLELQVMDATEFRCTVYTVRRYHLYNNKTATQSLRQTEFFTGEELSIALDRHVIKQAEESNVYIVTYTKPIPKDQRKASSPDPEPWRGN